MAKKLSPIYVQVGAPEWMTTFADMMSLLLTFFILLYSVSQVESKKVFEMGKSFDKYFNMDTEYFGFAPEQVRLEQLPEAFSELGEPDGKTGNEGRSLERREAEVIDRYASVSREESHHLIIIQGTVLFEPGTDRITEEVKPTLLRVAARLRGYANRIKVLGHTSPLPLSQAGVEDHDELGYRRARAVGRFLSGSGEDLVELARRLLPNRAGRMAADIFSVDPSRLLYASRGYHSPLSSGRLWEEPQRNDRVELILLPDPVENPAAE